MASYQIDITYKGQLYKVAKAELIRLATGEVMATVQNTDGVTLNLENPGEWLLKITDKKFKTVVYSLSDFESGANNSIELMYNKKPNLLLLAAAIAGIYMLAKKKKTVGKLEATDLLPYALILIGVLGFDVVRRLLEKLGIWDSKDTKALDDASTDPGSFWNPYYWQTVNPSGTGWHDPITEATAKAWCKEIYDSFGAFNDCEDCVIAVFKRCKTQANASFIAWAFNKYYQQDLLTFLRGGWWPQDRLSDTDVNTISNYISKLPKY